MRAVCGPRRKTGSCARPAAIFSASRSANTMSIAGLAAPRPVATINLPVQGDYAWTNAEGSHDSAREIGVAYHSRVRSLASVTGRVGYAWGRFLGYVRGGGAWERDDYWATTIILGTAYTARETRSGGTIGVGGEYAFTNLLSGFIEYSYYDFGTRQIAFTPQVAGLRPAFVYVKETKSVVRAGLNLRFGYAAPGAANY